MKKKTTAVIVMMAVIMTATAALAQHGIKCPKGSCKPDCKREMKCPKMTEEEKVQFETMRKLEKELHAELKKTIPDKTKAMTLKKQIVDLRGELSAKRFERMLNSPKPKDCPKLSETQKVRMKRIHELHEAIRTELEKDIPDKAQATALHNELLKLRKECELEGFAFMLNNPKKIGVGDCPGHRPNPECEF